MQGLSNGAFYLIGDIYGIIKLMIVSLEKEVWMPIKGYEGLYEVSNHGRIRSLPKRGFYKTALLKQRDNGFGYKICILTKNNKRRTFMVHRIVAEAFLPNTKNKKQVNHIDGNKYNNNLDNLEWCTNSENQLHKFRTLGCEAHGGKPKREIVCRETGIKYSSAYDASRLTGINRSNIFSVASRKYGYKTAGGFHWDFVV